MNQLKVFYLCSELTPFSESYNLASFSTRLTSILHSKDNYDIRLMQPKYGFISERKYILREVIRLKDMEIEFGNGKRLMNIKSAFIPETRVQVYFLQDDDYFKPLPRLLYKAKNGRVLSDNDIRFALFAKVALDTLKTLYWKPDIIVCNDWQMSFIPQLLKENYSEDEFYKDMKTVFLIHSINNYRNFSKKSYDSIQLDCNITKDKKVVDNYLSAIKYSDKTIIIDNDDKNIYNDIKADKDLAKVYRKSNHSEILLPNDASTSDWLGLIDKIDKALHE